VTVSDDSSGVVTGESFHFTASVAGSAGITPAGKVTWILTGPGSPTCSASTLSPAGVGTCVVSHPQTGTYTAIATYSGDINYNGGATGSDKSAAVGKASSKAILSISASSVVYGHEQTLKFSASVRPQFSGIPTGSVNVREGTRTLCEFALSAGKGSCSMPASASALLPVATYSVAAAYGGSADFKPSATSVLRFAVTKATSKTSLALSSPSVVYGHEQTLRFSINVNPQFSGIPTGTVTIEVNKKRVCSIIVAASSKGKGSCSPTATAVAVGTYKNSVIALFDGNTAFAGSVSSPATLMITKPT
jgi:5'-nucleotidase